MNSEVAAEPSSALLAPIVVRAQSGDQAAQAELFRRYKVRVENFVRGIVRQPTVAEDVTQSVFIKVIRKLPELRDPAAFESWVFTMARSTALDHLRRSRRHPEQLVDSFEDYNLTDTSRPWLMAEIVEALESALAKIPTVDRRLMHLLIDGNSYETIAARAGLTVPAVKARLNRARRFLRVAVGVSTGTRVERPAAPVVPMPARAMEMAAA